MVVKIPETSFIAALKEGISRTTELIARATEYHGGPVQTEYLITADVAREFIERDFEVKVECLNRKLIHGLTAAKKSHGKRSIARRKLGRKRTDVAVLKDGLIPLAIIEIKIGIRKFGRRLKDDLAKITTTIGMMRADYAANTIGAAVFQVHIPGSKNGFDSTAQLKAKAERVEKTLRADLMRYAKSQSDFEITMHPLQSPDGGIVATDVELDNDGEKTLGSPGHATRYHVVIIRSLRPVEPDTSNPNVRFRELKASS
jgi:hypothetical protein